MIAVGRKADVFSLFSFKKKKKTFVPQNWRVMPYIYNIFRSAQCSYNTCVSLCANAISHILYSIQTLRILINAVLSDNFQQLLYSYIGTHTIIILRVYIIFHNGVEKGKLKVQLLAVIRV